MTDFVECATCRHRVATGLTWCPFCGEELVAATEPTEADPAASGGEAEPFEADAGTYPGEADWIETEPDAFFDEAGAEPDFDEPGDEESDTGACVSCGRAVGPRLRWCPFCGTERAGEPQPAAAPLPLPDLDELPPPPEGFETLPEPDESEGYEPPPPARRTEAPLGVEDARPLPDFESERRRVRRGQVAGMVLSVVLIVGSVAFVVFLLVSLLGDDDAAGTDPATEGTTPSEVFTAFTPVPGDCVSYQADGEITEEPCDEPHLGEVFATPVYSPSDAPYPGDEDLADYAAERCIAAFAEYFGVDFYASGITFTFVTPRAGAWAEGSRRLLCIAEHPLGGTFDTGLRGSGGLDHAGFVPFSLLTAGTCWDFSEDTGELVPVVDCAAPHDVETFAAFDYPGDFPGDDAAQELGAQECSRRLVAYAGDVDDAVDYWAATPTEFDWPLGYRVVVCSAYRLDGAKLTGSLAG